MVKDAAPIYFRLLIFKNGWARAFQDEYKYDSFALRLYEKQFGWAWYHVFPRISSGSDVFCQVIADYCHMSGVGSFGLWLTD